jgi:SAM-dependent methyltransferase
MDAEQLRSTYNKYFKEGTNRWSSTDSKKTIKVARQTMKWLRKLDFRKANPKFLDVGCATGFYTEAFRMLGAQATGLDYSEVAVSQAKENFPACTFLQMNGFDPTFTTKFDIIFCRGFSGMNTHDLDFISSWINKYLAFLEKDGFFVLAYSTNYSGTEAEGETVNLSKDELEKLVQLINGKFRGLFIFYYFGWISNIKRRLEKVFNKGTKDYFYLFIEKTS